MNCRPTVGILGGAGPFGRGLARAIANGGAEVVIGSRDAARAGEVARRLCREDRGAGLAIRGGTNAAAAASGAPVFLAVPFPAQADLLRAVAPVLDGKMVVACGVIWPPGSRPETSAAEEARRVLREAGAGGVRVAAAFQTIAAGLLTGDLPPAAEQPDVLVFADREADRNEAADAAALTGLPAIPAGPLAQSRVAEAALGVLLALNRSGVTEHAGLRVTGKTGR